MPIYQLSLGAIFLLHPVVIVKKKKKKRENVNIRDNRHQKEKRKKFFKLVNEGAP